MTATHLPGQLQLDLNPPIEVSSMRYAVTQIKRMLPGAVNKLARDVAAYEFGYEQTFIKLRVLNDVDDKLVELEVVLRMRPTNVR